MVNATQMAKPFGKEAKHWLNNPQTKDFLDELTKVRNLTLTDLVQVKYGGKNPGTWMHKDVAMEFARWLSPAFAISLVWVYYAYSGWNAAAYISGDVENPQRTVPRALLCGTLLVAVLYLFLNMVFLRTAPVSELTGQIEIGLICAKHIFGENGGEIMGLLITVMLVSSISSMVFVGPRVGAAMGEDHRIFRFLTKKNDKGCPYISVWVQWLVSAVMLLSGSFRAITQYTGVVLSLCALLSVVGVIVHRHRYPNVARPYRTWAYPWPIIFFAAISLWSVTYMLYVDFTDGDNVPWTTILSFTTIFSGLILYWINKKIYNK